LGVVVEATAGVPHPVGLPTLVGHAFYLDACVSDICGRHSYIRIDLAVFQHKKRYIEVFITLRKRASSLNLNTAKHSFSDQEESGSKRSQLND
jgi:hypothetical protein